MRRRIALVVSGVLLAAAFSAALVIDQEVALTVRGIEYPLTATALPERIPRLGVNVDLLQYPSEALDAQLKQMRAAGVTWLRQIVDWRSLEPTPSVIDWSAWDTIFEALDAYPDLHLVPVFYRTPRWASAPEHPDHPTLPPQNPADLAAFAAAFAQRYGDWVDYYQIWDEPNLYDAWGQTPPSSAHYVAMAAAASEAIRHADPTAKIIAAALAPTTEDNARNIMDWHYLRQLYQHGMSAFVDAVAAKPYGFDHSPDDRTINPARLNFSRVVVLREIMLEHGDAHKPLWFSEWGWNALPSNWSGAPSIWGQVSSTQQAAYTLSALARIEQEWPFVGAAILSEWQPNRPPEDPRWGFALVGQHGQPSPLLTALQSQPRQALPANGFYPPTVASAAYSGLWTFGPLGADIGWLETSDSQLRFQFHGRDIGLMLRQGDFIAYLYPTLDGFTPNAVQRDSSGNSFILLRSDSQQPEVRPVPIATNLPLSAHTLHVVADRGWDQWVLAGYLVSDGDIAGPLIALRQAAWLVAAVAASAFVFTAGMAAWPLRLPSTMLMWMERPLMWGISLVSTFALTAGMLLSLTDGAFSLLRRDMAYHLTAVALSAGLLAFELSALLVLGACLVLFVVFYHRPIIGLALTLLYAPFFLFPVELYQFAFPLTELLLLITAAASGLRWLVDHARRRQTATAQFPARIRWRWHMLDGFAVAYLFLGLVALSISPNRAPAITEFRTLIIEPILFYALIRVHVTRSQLFVLVQALLAGAVVVCAIGLANFITGTHLITAEEGTRRLASVYGSPNNVALLLVRCLPFALALALFHRGRWRGVYAVAGALFLITLVLTQSTGGLLLGLPAGLITVLLLTRGRQAVLPVLGVGVIVLVFVGVAAQVSPRFASLFDFTGGTNFIRLRLWESSLAMIEDFPVTGVGLDQFLERYRGTYVKPDAIWDSQLNHPHNLILDVWLRLGIGGVIWLIGIACVLVILSRRLLSITPVPTERALLIGALGALSALIAHGMVDNSLFVVDLAIIFWLIAATLVQISLGTPPPTDDAPRV
ncbi:MAG: O-antigen ligase family protein [Aggregatilineales bacterium]